MLFVLTASLLTGCTTQETETKGRFVAYIPTTVGDKWVMVDQDGPVALEHSHEVTAVEAKDGELFVTVFMKMTGPGKVVKKKVSLTGEYLLQEGETRYDPPIRVLPPTITEGDRWQWEKPGVAKWTYTAGKEEQVEVPAGKFKARRIVGEGQSEGKPITCTQWLAAGHPTIKTVIRFDDGSEIVEVLKSFTPGKK
jgi:hypothetical protein